MKSIFLSWIGDHDLDFIIYNENKGPILAWLNSDFCNNIDEIHLLYDDHKIIEAQKYISYIKNNYSIFSQFHNFKLSDPTDYKQIYEIVKNVMGKILKNNLDEKVEFHIHTSPGTNQMASIWLLLAATIYPAKLYQSHYNKETKEQRVKICDIPFNIEVEYIPEIKKIADNKLLEYWNIIPKIDNIIFKSEIMKNLIKHTIKLSNHDVPVLILGESGTGKELIAESIHKLSLRSSNKFIILNCAALHESTAEATLFGWSKGAWTGSIGEGPGLFKECNNGTIFLDEIGDLSLGIQTKLLRTIQNGEIQRVGDGRVTKVNVRVVSATNKNLIKMISEGMFREDLFYRLNIGTIQLPALRERGNDAVIIAEHFLEQINHKFQNDQFVYRYISKKFSLNTKKFILGYDWPGNIRELYNAIERACIWNDTEVITDTDFAQAITKFPGLSQNNLHEMIPRKGFNLGNEINKIKKNYIEKVLNMTSWSKVETAKILGYKSYQALSYDMRSLGIKEN